MADRRPANQETQSATAARVDRAARAAAAARLCYGLLLVVDPARPARALGARPGPAAEGVLRFLGVRHVAQAALTIASPRRPVLAAGAAADGLHASTDLFLAAVAPGWRWASSLDAVIAGGLGAFSLALTRRARARVGGRAGEPG